MAKITKITINGFKSFGKEINLEFPVDFSVVVGPNGSGKSNIIDAICFVLGTSRSKVMRVKRFSDLIFNGGEGGTPREKAEVSIYFDNSQGDFNIEDKELKISRIVSQKSSQNVYKVNNKRASRTEILNLLSQAKINPDSYNIVLQGDVSNIIETSPVRRRVLVDELAGLSTYEEKREMAQKQMEKVNEKLGELSILLSERKRVLDDLKDDRDKALIIKDLSERKGLLEGNFLLKKLEIEQENLKKKKIEVDNLKSKKNQLIKDQRELEKALAQQNAQLQQLSEKIEQEGHSTHVQMAEKKSQLMSEIKITKEKLEEQQQHTQELHNRVNHLTEELKQHMANLGQVKKEISTLHNEKEEINSVFLKHEAKLNSMREKFGSNFAELDNKRRNKQSTLTELKNKQLALTRKFTSLEVELQNNTDKINKKRYEEVTSELRNLQKRENTLLEVINRQGSESGNLTNQYEAARSKLEKTEELYNREMRKLETISKKPPAVEAILEAGKNNVLEGIVGSVIDLISIPPEYSLAIQSCGGARLGAIVVEHDYQVVEAIKFLKKKAIGKARFLPLDKLKLKAINQNAQAVESKTWGFVKDHIQYDPSLEKVIRYVFGSTLLVDTVEDARKIGFNVARMVTVGGDLIEGTGAVIGGHNKSGGPKVDLTKLKDDINRLTRIKENVNSQRSEIDNQVFSARQQYAEVKAKREVLTREKAGLQFKDTDQLEKEFNRAKQKLDAINNEISSLEKEIQDLNEIISKKASNSKEVQELEIKVNELRLQLQEKDVIISKKENELKHVHERDMDGAKNALIDTQKQIRLQKEKTCTIEKNITEKEDELKVVKEELKKVSAKLAAFLEEKKMLEKQIRLSEQTLYRETNELKNLIDKISIESENLGKLEGEIQELSNEVDLTIERVDLTLDAIKKELKKIEKKLNDIGPVNPEVINKYDFHKNEYDTIKDKFDVLTNEKDVIYETIEKLEIEKTAAFLDVFNVLRTNFQNVCENIKEGWSGDLVLENPEDPLSGGLILKANPAGKNQTHIESMSGGEKVLTAIAFLFAIQKFNPAPFYILDEVDAALDKINLELFASALHGQREKSQFIVITHHNEHLMRKADQLIGVTVKNGNSKIVGVKLEKNGDKSNGLV